MLQIVKESKIFRFKAQADKLLEKGYELKHFLVDGLDYVGVFIKGIA